MSSMLGRKRRPPHIPQALGHHVGAGAVASQLPFSMLGEAEAADKAAATARSKTKRSVCTHCSVGCAIDAVVQNGVWVRQEPVFDSPINLGAHCAKGASIREHGMTHDSHRLKYPMKLVAGKWQRISWDEALDEVSQKLLEIRKETGPDATFWIGSSKHNNEQAYLLRKFVSVLGHEQHGPPGAHLPLDHGRGCGEHLGLWRDDELVQRRAEFEERSCSSAATRPRRTRSRCCTRCTRKRRARR